MVLVTHDRHLLDRVSTQVLALDGEGGVDAFADLGQWQSAQAAAEAAQKAGPERPAPARAMPPAKRLSYHEQREWEQIEAAILAAEATLAACRAGLEDPAIVADAAEVARRYAATEAASSRVDALYARWSELDAKQR